MRQFQTGTGLTILQPCPVRKQILCGPLKLFFKIVEGGGAEIRLSPQVPVPMPENTTSVHSTSQWKGFQG